MNESYEHNWKLYTLILLGISVTIFLIFVLSDKGLINLDARIFGGIFSGFVGLVIFILFVLAGFCLYFLPAIIANYGKHHNATGITVLNLLLGWTFLGWVIALVWAFSTGSQPVTVTQTQNNYFCRRCNSLNPISQKFCGSCGFQNYA